MYVLSFPFPFLFLLLLLPLIIHLRITSPGRMFPIRNERLRALSRHQNAIHT